MCIIINMAKNSKNTVLISRHAQLLLETLGAMIKAARIERCMSQADLGERVGVSRYTISVLEKGNPNVAIGTVFEAATIVGIPLMGGDPHKLANLSQSLANFLQILPSRGVSKKVELDDNF
jgi:DNA-binding XRE family transcriptional regulator